jgi:hypothetical protein
MSSYNKIVVNQALGNLVIYIVLAVLYINSKGVVLKT